MYDQKNQVAILIQHPIGWRQVLNVKGANTFTKAVELCQSVEYEYFYYRGNVYTNVGYLVGTPDSIGLKL